MQFKINGEEALKKIQKRISELNEEIGELSFQMGYETNDVVTLKNELGFLVSLIKTSKPKLSHKACSAIERMQWALDNKLDIRTRFLFYGLGGEEKVVVFCKTNCCWFEYLGDNRFSSPQAGIQDYNIEEI